MEGGRVNISYSNWVSGATTAQQRQPKLASSMHKPSAVMARARRTPRHSRFSIFGGIHHPGSVVGAGSESQVARDEATVAMSGAAGNVAVAAAVAATSVDHRSSATAPCDDTGAINPPRRATSSSPPGGSPMRRSALANGRTPAAGTVTEAWSRSARHSRFSVVGGIHHPASVPGASIDVHLRRDDKALADSFARATEARPPSSAGEEGHSTPPAATELDTTEDGATWEAATLELVSHYCGERHSQATPVAPGAKLESQSAPDAAEVTPALTARAAPSEQVGEQALAGSWRKQQQLVASALFLVVALAMGFFAIAK